MARRVAADLANPDTGDDDDLDVRDPVQAVGDDADQPDDADDEADDDTSEDDEVDAAGQQDDEPAPRRRVARERDRDDDREARLTAAEERAAAAERRAIEIEARYNAQQQTQQGETPEQEAARTALMTPEQLIDYKVTKALGNHQRTTQQMVLNASNTADKASFDALVRENPSWKKVASEVERKHAELVAKGQYPTRETVLKYVLGEQAMKMAANTRREGGERKGRVERERTRPLANRSEVAPQSRRGGKTAEDRLDGVLL